MKNMMNVTENIRAVVKEAQIELFFRDEKIGTISISPDEQRKLELHQDYVMENGKIFKYMEHLQGGHPKAYVEGCDLGWC
ncbi:MULTISPECIES: DUF2553 family protein [Bacillaceae]|uniref:DUF2553 family protein n=1 Tax=Bacillaceae TaxID=186817 RepID=UPI00159BB120|nr:MULTISPECIES: DUF2553 family protein [Bacillaceae]MCM3032574.1 YusG family protein [Niallia sp. MER 6]